MTNLCCFNQDSHRFSAFKHYAALAASKQVNWEEVNVELFVVASGGHLKQLFVSKSASSYHC